MESAKLIEAASLVSESASEDGTWKVRLISEGKGSSGVYTRELLERYHHAFDNVLSFKNHPTTGPHERDFTMVAGRVRGETWVETEADGSAAVYANYEPDPEYRDKIARYKESIGLSIYITGTGHTEEATGEFIIESFDDEDPFRSVDVVIAPGARGRFLESMREVYSAPVEEKPTVTVAEEERNKKIMEEKLDKAIELLTQLVADKSREAVEAAQVAADAEAAKTAVEAYDAAVKAVDAADLFESQREAILAAAKDGQDVSGLIESAKKVKEEALKAVESVTKTEEVEGVVLGEAAVSYGFGKAIR